MNAQQEDYSSTIRMAAMQTLTPEEQQVVAQSVTPAFVQAMAKLFGEQAVSLLKPLMQLPQTPPSAPTSLASFNATASANGNQQVGQQPEMAQPYGSSPEQQEEPCPMCGGQNPDCPACSLPYPTSVNFRN